MVDRNVRVGNVSDVSGEVNIAGGDIYKGFSSEQVSALLTQITSTFQSKPFDGHCPYKGLDVFEEEDAGLFFGREKLVEELLRRVKASRTIFITGQSGSGKSSLVRAGLIHALKQGAINALRSNHWLYETMKPGRDPLEALALVFSRLKSPELSKYFRENVDHPDILHECAESALSDRQDQRLVLFIDQFEEVFTQVGKEKTGTFINLLTHAATIANGRVIILFAMRSDFVSNCAPYPQLNALLSQQFIQIGAMQPDELVSAIAQPALRVGLRIDPDLIAQIIKDMEGEPGALPLMQFALKDLFDSQQEKNGVIALTLNDYLQRGGIQKSLERHADDAFTKLSQSEQELARSIFSGLIEIGRGTQDTAHTAFFDDLIPANKKAEEVKATLQKLADARLITTDEKDERNTVTISHEKLIDAWPWLKKLVNENRDVIALQNEIASDAKEWEDHQRDSSYLYTGARLASAREQLETKKLVLSGLAQIFVDTGIGIEETKHREEEIRQRTQLTLKIVRQRALYLTIALIVALIAVGAAVFFGVQSRQQALLAQAQASLAQALEFAVTSGTLLDLDSELSLHIAMQSISDTHTLQGEEALRRALVAPPVELTLHGHSGAVYSVAYDHDGKRLVTASEDGTARIWDAATGRELMVLHGHSNVVKGAVFSPNGQLVATASVDKTVRIWEAKTGQELCSNKHENAINSIAFSSDGQHIVTASDDKTARVWEVATCNQVFVLEKHTAEVRSAVFSSNGKWIATGGNDQTINIWDAITGQLIKSLSEVGEVENIDAMAFSPDSQYIINSWGYAALRWDVLNGSVATRYAGHAWYLTSVAFNPSDGRQVVTASRDHTVRIWDTESGTEIEVLHGQSGEIYSVAFDSTGGHLATASEDQTVRIWNIAEWRKRVLVGHVGYVNGAVYSSDGGRIATTGSDGMIRIWDASTGRELKAWNYPGGTVNHLQFSPNDKQLITSSDDGTWRLWEIATSHELYRSEINQFIVSDARFNHDGTRIIITRRDGLAIIWDVATMQQLVQLIGHNSAIWTGAFSPNGELAVTASADNTARVWDAQTGKLLHVLSGHSDLVTSADFNTDGKRIVTTSVDGTARVWDTKTGQMLLVLKGHKGEVTDAVFSPDDQYVATVSRDHTFILWNAATGEEIIQPIGQTKDIFSVTFSPDGRYLITASLDGTARIYPVHFEDVLALAQSLLSPRNLTCAERMKYLNEQIICPTPMPTPN